MRKIDIIGKKFGRLVVLRADGTYKTGTKVYLCECECGNTCRTSSSHLRNGNVKSCGCLSKEVSSKTGKRHIKPMLGKKFGKLLVLEEGEHTKHGVKWICKCDCGNESIVLGVSLRQGRINSCGCLNLELLYERNKNKKSDNPWKTEMIIYQHSAKQRELVFELTELEFKNLILGDCYYCGEEPKIKCHSKELRDNNILKNGIDRVNSQIGYVYSNCVSCCWICNAEKSSKNINDFILHTKKRYEFLKKKGFYNE